MFELQHDANNLDKNLKSGASQLLDQNLGAEASKDLGLESSNSSASEVVVTNCQIVESIKKGFFTIFFCGGWVFSAIMRDETK